MTEAEKAYQYFVIAVPENEEQAKAYFWARKVLQLTLTPPNKPLTSDELLKMDGQPVYVVFRPDNSGDKPQFWALVSADKQDDEVYLLDSMGGAGSYDEIWANIEAIYRRPPEGEEDT